MTVKLVSSVFTLEFMFLNEVVSHILIVVYITKTELHRSDNWQCVLCVLNIVLFSPTNMTFNFNFIYIQYDRITFCMKLFLAVRSFHLGTDGV